MNNHVNRDARAWDQCSHLNEMEKIVPQAVLHESLRQLSVTKEYFLIIYLLIFPGQEMQKNPSGKLLAKNIFKKM